MMILYCVMGATCLVGVSYCATRQVVVEQLGGG